MNSEKEILMLFLLILLFILIAFISVVRILYKHKAINKKEILVGFIIVIIISIVLFTIERKGGIMNTYKIEAL